MICIAAGTLLLPQFALAGPQVSIAGGPFTPLYSPDVTPASVTLATYRLDAMPVTQGEYLTFVRAHPQWRRSRAPAIFRDRNYLADWKGDLELSSSLAVSAPVTNISWFAARAFCKAENKRLPTQNEWEYAAMAGRKSPDGRAEAEFQRDVLGWYVKPAAATLRPVGQTPPNLWGVYDLHILVWEWVDDFNASLSTGDNRADAGEERGLFCGGTSGAATDRSDYAAYMRFAYRSSLVPEYAGRNLGFRCAAPR